MAYTKKAAAADVYRHAFGVVLTSQGRGYYVTMELLAIVWGTSRLAESSVLPAFDPDQRSLAYMRRGHDFARRIMSGPGGKAVITDADRAHLRGSDTEGVLRALLESLRVPIPGRRTLPDWGGQHLYPYIGELIHYDAVARKNGKPSIERYAYRGAGGFVHKVLRTDPDQGRLSANREGLTRLVSDAGGPLGQLALACAGHDLEQPERAFEDELEPATVAEDSVWIEHIRNGTRNIVGRSETMRSKQVEMLMHWLPYCVARYQLDVAAHECGLDSPRIPVALVQRPTPIRKLARQELERARTQLERALAIAAGELALTADEARRQTLLDLPNKAAWSRPSVAFFTQTLASCGALNAYTGSRYFTLKLPLLEAIVSATLEPGRSQEFDDFCETTLFGRLGLVVDRKSAIATEMVSAVDAADFANNADQLAADLAGLGLVSEYSDATRMVHGEVQ